VVEAPEPTAADLLAREFLDRPGPQVAPDLLGCVLEREAADGLVAVMLTEVEAYNGEKDPASHAYRGRTKRNAVMYGPAGHAYVYFTYGMHFCVNVVCMPDGTASAVLLRAGKVIAGEDLARRRRFPASLSREPKGARESRDLARGPGRLCQALGIDRNLDGADLCVPDSPLRLRAPSRRPPAGERGGEGVTPLRSGQESLILSGPRVGVREGAEVPWRFWLAGEPTVSPYRPYARRR
jgi:DNA-3-methyladenine glycosylase